MNFQEAKGKSITKKIIGIVIAVPAIISTFISILKVFYFRIDDGSQIGGAIARPFKQLVFFIYEKTQALNFFWNNSPTPNHAIISEPHNIYFIVIYLIIFVGFAFYASGKKTQYSPSQN